MRDELRVAQAILRATPNARLRPNDWHRQRRCVEEDGQTTVCGESVSTESLSWRRRAFSVIFTVCRRALKRW